MTALTIDALSALVKAGIPTQAEIKTNLSDETEATYLDFFKTTPVIPIHVLQNLPQLLKEGCNAFLSPRERDVFLTCSLSVISSCFPTIYGIYDGRKVFANLFSLVIAPASSGKGALTYAQALGNNYHKKLKEQTRRLQIKYDAELEEYNNDKKKAKDLGDDFNKDKPEYPPKLQLFIPADNSTASLIQAMFENQGRGLMCETEADTLSNTLSQDWGNFSHLLRKAFHHEKIEYQRKGGKEHYEIEKPCLSIALTGTPNSVLKLIPSTEDGLFSRFLYYCFKEDPTWRDVSPHADRVILDDHFDLLSDKFMKVIKFYTEDLKKEGYEHIIFELKESHWTRLNDQFSLSLNKNSKLISEDVASVIRRLGLITFRIAMLLSGLRAYENGRVTVPKFYCEDVDFENAMILADIYLNHAIIMYHQLPKEAKLSNDISPLRTKFYDELPNEFQKKKADEIGKSLMIAHRTVTQYLKFYMENKLLEKPEYGNYKKIYKQW